jgi:Helix-turn-helix domain
MSKHNAIARAGFDVVTYGGDGEPVSLEEQHRRLLDRFLTGNSPTGPPVLLTVSEVAALLRCSISSLNKWRCLGGGPTFVKVGARVRYRLPDIAAWITQERRTSTSASAA